MNIRTPGAIAPGVRMAFVGAAFLPPIFSRQEISPFEAADLAKKVGFFAKYVRQRIDFSLFLNV
ncbi:MAG: hypothetical protein IKM42_06905 [Clostridia bacterium]|nr:hypothetical protein [Clostridia bacterium]MBR7111922.1 hypothetical protein [Clostridia bacterium]